MPTIGDVYRVYVKPSLKKGYLVIRKRSTRQVSPNVEASKERVRAFTKTRGAPAKLAHDKCIEAGKGVEKIVYEPGRGYVKKVVCPIEDMRTHLREVMEEVQSGAKSHKRAVAGVAGAGAGGFRPKA